MEAHGNPIIIYLLIGAFLAVGIHLIIYTRKRRNMLTRFARKRGLRHQLEDSGELETELNTKLFIEEPGMARAFMKIKDIVADGPIRLFRCIELLDLSRYGSAMSGHTNHICATFPVPDRIDVITIVDKDGTVHHRYPKDKKIKEDPDFL